MAISSLSQKKEPGRTVSVAVGHVPHQQRHGVQGHRDQHVQRVEDLRADDARQQETTGGLSGGWKMKLELARAMLYNADLLLLDEVCIHNSRFQNIH